MAKEKSECDKCIAFGNVCESAEPDIACVEFNKRLEELISERIKLAIPVG